MAEVQIHEVGQEFYLLRSPETDLHRNIYVKRFINGESRVNLICDPGTRLDIPMLMEALKRLIGGAQNINVVFLSHQDPDVSSNTPTLLQLAPHATVVASVDTWRLVKMYGIPDSRFYGAESAENAPIQVKSTGHRLHLVPAHYCHFRGALMLYDIESRVLFTGDLFGGLDTRKGEGIWADESSWEGIALFHQVYMPNAQALEVAVDRIASLRPEPLTIAPQHGDVIGEPLVIEFASRLARLEVALDILGKPGPERDLTLVCINDFLDGVRQRDTDVHERVLRELQSPHGFTSLFVSRGEALIDIKVAPKAALSAVGRALQRAVTESEADTFRALLVAAIEQYSLVPPPELIAAACAPHTPFGDGEPFEGLSS